MATPEIRTVREQVAWSYANLARADAALSAGHTRHKRLHHVIRSRLYHGLLSGKMTMRSLYDDEREKMIRPQACFYCGDAEKLAVDHLVPRIRGGPDDSDNLVWACRSCNSSKQGRDMLEWLAVKGRFPPILLLRRYLKIVARHCEATGCLDEELSQVGAGALPFDLSLLPTRFPPLTELQRWACADGEAGGVQ